MTCAVFRVSRLQADLTTGFSIMSFQLNLPPSEIGRLARSEQSAGGGERQKQSREDWKKMKELEEARKAGTAPAMQDEEGK